jgi:transposase-like protein
LLVDTKLPFDVLRSGALAELHSTCPSALSRWKPNAGSGGVGAAKAAIREAESQPKTAEEELAEADRQRRLRSSAPVLSVRELEERRPAENEARALETRIDGSTDASNSRAGLGRKGTFESTRRSPSSKPCPISLPHEVR